MTASMPRPAQRPPEAAPPCTARDPRVAAALQAVPREAFPPLQDTWRELPPEALLRVVEDLQVPEHGRVLVVEPLSGLLPTVLCRLAGTITVVCQAPARACRLAEQLARAGFDNVRLSTFLPPPGAEAEGRFDRLLVLQPPQQSLPPDLRALLTDQGLAILALDEALPARRMLRVMRLQDGSTAEEEIDLSRFMPMLGDMLVEAGCVLRQDVAEAKRALAKTGRMLGQELLQRGLLREDDLYRTLAEQRHMAFTHTSSVLARLDRELARQLPRKYLDHYPFLPIRHEKGRIVVATTNVDLPLWELRAVFDGVELVAELITPTDLQRVWTAIELGFVQSRTVETDRSIAAEATEDPVIEDSRAAGLFDAIVQDAVAERASDIHLENYDTGARLRFRIDGSLHDITRYQLSSDDLVALLNVVKIQAKLDIAERRLPQSGRVHRRVGKRLLDLRVQTQPTLFHETVVIRILPQDVRPPTIEELGFSPSTADRYRRVLMDPHGLVLVVGATGSGKSTTLYAGLQLLAKDTTRKVLTIEDPIEFSLPGIQQSQVNAAVGFRFADAVRSFVRQDPDVVMVGEIRDGETALETIRAAQTGHLVLATLHCNDTVDAVQRLCDLGVHPNSIASELTAVIAQRLARRICTACKRRSEPSQEMVAELFPHGLPAGFQCYEGKGCGRCGDTGTRGRVAIVEFLQVVPELRRAIGRRVVLDDLRALAHRSGLQTLRDSALQLVQQGVIPMAELYDVLSTEQMRPLA